MANDPTQDKDFLAAPPERQHAYLMATDPDYAKAPPERQQAYLASLRPPDLKTGAGMENYSQKQARQTLTGTGRRNQKIDYSTAGKNIVPIPGTEKQPPLAYMDEAAQNQELDKERMDALQNRALQSPTPVTNASIIYATPLATSREALLRGTAAIARTAVGAAGGMYGGGKVGRYIGGRLGNPEAGETLGNFIGGAAGAFLGGTGRYLPSRYSLLERLLASGQPEATSAEAAAIRSIQSPEPGVSVVPEPRPALPGDKPGAMWSADRGTLPQAAQQGVPGAADVLRNTGRTILFSPREGTGFPGPRSVTAIPQGSPTLFPEPPPTLPTVVQSEGAPPPVANATSPATPAASPVGGSQVLQIMPPPEGAVINPGPAEPWDEAAKRRAPGISPERKSIRRKFGQDTSKMAEYDKKIAKQE